MKNLIRIALFIVTFTTISVSPVFAATDTTASLSFDNLYQIINPAPVATISLPVDTSAVSATSNPTVFPRSIPEVIKTIMVSATGYSSTVSQTDDSPFITASNTYVHDGVIAANFLPFGTKVEIPSIYGDKVFVVEDRMNKRYTDRVDIWFASTQAALTFGIKKDIQIEIVS